MLVFIIGIILCALLIVCAITNTLVYYVIGLGAIILVATIVLYVYGIKERITRKKGRPDQGQLIYCKYLLPFKGKGYHIIKFKYVDDSGVARTRIDLVNYSDFDMIFLEDEEGMIDILVYKKFAVTTPPTVKIKRKKKDVDEDEVEEKKDSLKMCPYCGYKTFENDFKCPMCGGDLEIKKSKKNK